MPSKTEIAEKEKTSNCINEYLLSPATRSGAINSSFALLNPIMSLWLFLITYIFVGFLFELNNNPKS